MPRMNPGAQDKVIAAPKCPREHLTYLRVEGLHCPALLARLLAMLTRHALRPVDVQLDRTGKWQRIEITLGGRYYDLPRQLLARVEAVKEVRTVELTDVAGRPLIPAGKPSAPKRAAVSAARPHDAVRSAPDRSCWDRIGRGKS